MNLSLTSEARSAATSAASAVASLMGCAHSSNYYVLVAPSEVERAYDCDVDSTNEQSFASGAPQALHYL